MTKPAAGHANPGGGAPRWLFLATTTSALTRRHERLNRLVELGEHVVLVHRGPLDRGTLDPRVVVHDDSTPPHLGNLDVRRVASRLPSWAAARLDRWDPVSHSIRGADRVVLLDPSAAELLDDLHALPGSVPVWPSESTDEGLRQNHHWRVLEERLADLEGLPPAAPRPTHRVRVSVEALAGRDPLVAPRVDRRIVLADLAQRAYNRGDLTRGDSLARGISLFEPRFGPDRRLDLVLRASRTRATLLVEPGGHDIEGVVAELLDEADRSIRDRNVDDAALFTTEVLGLLFHRVLHTTTRQTPLVDDPAAFLRGWHLSEVAAALADSTQLSAGGIVARTPGPPRVLLLPGTYAHHVGPLLRAIERTGAELTFHEPVAPILRGMVPGRDLVALRIRHALGLRTPRQVRNDDDVAATDAGLAAALEAADVVVVDWADKAAVWTSMALPEGTRMVLRIHSADSLLAPLHLVDWSRVDDIIFVSAHIRDVFESLGLQGVRARRHVVLNTVETARFSVSSHPDAARTLGMVAWGRRIKDPAMALDILALLLQRDPSWRLRLIGDDFPDDSSSDSMQYHDAFRRRALELDVVEHIDYVGQTQRLPDQLAHVGFIVSTSLRESCPVGVLEGVAAGAVPVVREWPTFAALRGARRIFGERYVVESSEEAADLVWSLRDPDDRNDAAKQVQAALHDEILDEGSVLQRLGRIILPD